MKVETVKEPKTEGEVKSRRSARTSTSYFHIGMGLFLLLIMFFGFWSSYFGAVLPGVEMAPPTGGIPAVIHIHAAVFIGWFLLYIYQSTLIFQKKIKTHNTAGRYGMFLGAAVVITGLLVLFFQQYELITNKGRSLTKGTIGTIGVWMQMVNFAVLLFLGYKTRRKPDFHKRYILFATIALMPAALVRTLNLDFIWNTIGIWSPAFLALLILAIVMVHDYLTFKKIHKVTLIGSGLLIIDMALLFMGLA